MKSLFNKDDVSSFIERMNNLKTNAPPLWGKMNAAQMLAHCCVPLESAVGKEKLKRAFIGYLFGAIALKKMVGNDKPFDKNLPTDKRFVMKANHNFAEEKTRLISLIHKFSEAGPEGITRHPHPFFGKMTPGEWDIMMSKHLDHHFRQFGV